MKEIFWRTPGTSGEKSHKVSDSKGEDIKAYRALPHNDEDKPEFVDVGPHQIPLSYITNIKDIKDHSGSGHFNKNLEEIQSEREELLTLPPKGKAENSLPVLRLFVKCINLDCTEDLEKDYLKKAEGFFTEHPTRTLPDYTLIKEAVLKHYSKDKWKSDQVKFRVVNIIMMNIMRDAKVAGYDIDSLEVPEEPESDDSISLDEIEDEQMSFEEVEKPDKEFEKFGNVYVGKTDEDAEKEKNYETSQQMKEAEEAVKKNMEKVEEEDVSLSDIPF